MARRDLLPFRPGVDVLHVDTHRAIEDHGAEEELPRMRHAEPQPLAGRSVQARLATGLGLEPKGPCRAPRGQPQHPAHVRPPDHEGVAEMVHPESIGAREFVGG